MMIGPEPITRIRWMSVRLGTYRVSEFIGIKITEDDRPGAVSWPAHGRGPVVFRSKKGEPNRLPFPSFAKKGSRSGLPSGRAHNLTRVKAASAHLHLRDLAIDDDTRDLQIRLPGATRLVVRVRNVVSVGDTFVADVTAVSLDLR